MVLLQQEDDANAERALAEAVRLAPNEGVIRFRHAEALTQLGRFEEAVSALVASIEASPTEARPYLALARMLEASGQHERAIAVLECELAAMTQDVRLQEEAARIRSAWNESSLNVQSTTS
jgi:Flp pilus assembly protein TadD